MTVKELREYALLKRHELEEQADVCQWLDVMGILYFAVPNGGKRGKKAQAQAKSEGLKSGVPDLVILLPLGRAVFVEMKRRKGGTVTTAQKQWVADLSALGFAVKVCRGSDEAIAFISSMLVIK